MRADAGRGPLRDEAIDAALDRCRKELAAVRPATVGSWTKVNVFGASEPVTTADVAVQRTLLRACRLALPEVPVIAEEGQETLGHIPGTCVLIDPIDGTIPFLSGSSLYTISICLVVDDRPLHAVVDFPAYGVRVWARADRGIDVRGDVGGLPAFGSSSLLVSPAQAARVRAALVKARARAPAITVTPVPTTSAKMVLVALLKAGAALRVRGASAGVAPWDYAAAALIAREAGATVRDDGGRDLARGAVSAVNGWMACRRPPPAPLAVLRRVMAGEQPGAF